MDFKKYKSIENSYQMKYLLKAISAFPELQETRFIAREKIDGANLQLVFTPKEPMKVGRRSAFLKQGEAFFDVWATLNRYLIEIETIQSEADYTGTTIRLYGEIYGKGVQDRVDYGDAKAIAFFDMEVNNTLLAPVEFEARMKEMGLSWLIAPRIAIVDTLKDALALDVTFNTKLNNKDNNAAEGIVIQPYDKVIYIEDDRFILKKKNEAFAEKERKAKAPATEAVNGEHLALLTSFRSYINKNRVLSVFSKHGPMTSIKDMGKYIKLVQEDAKEDFLKENELPQLDEKAQKLVFNVGSDIALLLKSFL